MEVTQKRRRIPEAGPSAAQVKENLLALGKRPPPRTLWTEAMEDFIMPFLEKTASVEECRTVITEADRLRKTLSEAGHIMPQDSGLKYPKSVLYGLDAIHTFAQFGFVAVQARRRDIDGIRRGLQVAWRQSPLLMDQASPEQLQKVTCRNIPAFDEEPWYNAAKYCFMYTAPAAKQFVLRALVNTWAGVSIGLKRPSVEDPIDKVTISCSDLEKLIIKFQSHGDLASVVQVTAMMRLPDWWNDVASRMHDAMRLTGVTMEADPEDGAFQSADAVPWDTLEHQDAILHPTVFENTLFLVMDDFRAEQQEDAGGYPEDGFPITAQELSTLAQRLPMTQADLDILTPLCSSK